MGMDGPIGWPFYLWLFLSTGSLPPPCDLCANLGFAGASLPATSNLAMTGTDLVSVVIDDVQICREGDAQSGKNLWFLIRS